jgi:non-canonical purine NTP pyrophosphatase (RdgB/HAM1 family)
MLTLVTGNAHKAQEIQAVLGLPVRAVKLDVPELQAVEVRDVVEAKAKAAFALVQGPVLVDDSGLHIEALGGLPGALATWFLQAVGPEGVLRMMGLGGDRRAKFVTCIGYCVEKDNVAVFVGTLTGTIAEAARGQNGFGFDGIFIPDGATQTLGEMSVTEKNACSARSLALTQLRAYWRER